MLDVGILTSFLHSRQQQCYLSDWNYILPEFLLPLAVVFSIIFNREVFNFNFRHLELFVRCPLVWVCLCVCLLQSGSVDGAQLAIALYMV